MSLEISFIALSTVVGLNYPLNLTLFVVRWGNFFLMFLKRYDTCIQVCWFLRSKDLWSEKLKASYFLLNLWLWGYDYLVEVKTFPWKLTVWTYWECNKDNTHESLEIVGALHQHLDPKNRNYAALENPRLISPPIFIPLISYLHKMFLSLVSINSTLGSHESF